MNKYIGYFFSIKYKIFGAPKFKQEMLLRLALKERGFNLKKITIIVDHNLGINYINGIKTGIIYPDSFFDKAVELIPINKRISYYFNGNMSPTGGRKAMLEKFINSKNSIIIESQDGRVDTNKDKFNEVYFKGLANSQFGLCPHQTDWSGDVDSLWTYRFIECCFTDTIPILFRETPLSDNFTHGFYFLWDDQIMDVDNLLSNKYDAYNALENRNKSKKIFCLSDQLCKLINQTLNK